LHVSENQIGPLVSGKAAGKSDGKGVRTEHATKPRQHFLRFTAAIRLLDRTAAHKFKQPGLQVEVGLPKLSVVDVLDSFPSTSLTAGLGPACAEMPVIQAIHLRSQPGWNMNPVGDVPDGNFV